MLLSELEALKQRRDMGVLIHREKWTEILLWAIELTKHHESSPSDPIADDEGWIMHTTGKQPVENDVVVDVVLKTGSKGQSTADDWRWTFEHDGDILKYRIVK